ncbi:MAG: aspartate--tRNA ligase [Planctomycetota bacterium]|jgi:aspartyl-tRNA synthetase
MTSWQRTHTCGELSTEEQGREVVLNGWVENYRDHGGILFLDVRDRYGVTQVIVDQERPEISDKMFEAACRLRAETVVSVRGVVAARDADKINPKRITGAIEVFASAIEVLAEADTPPFEVLDKVEANEELRMRYRYLDLRRQPMARALEQRSRFITAVRTYLAERDFVDVETPILTKSTPEGARDYLVPSRVTPGHFYALPQSPQIFKQLLMVGGLDRYYQIARCFRDEDLRADRQPEFTQIDLEMSFVEEEGVMNLVEGMMVRGLQDGFGIEVPTPFERLSYQDAMHRFGTDKPDLRFGMELQDITELAGRSDFKVFSQTVADHGMVKGLVVAGAAENFSRKDIDGLTAMVREYGAKGLAWAKITGEGVTGSIGKFFGGEKGAELIAAMAAKPTDLLLFVADRAHVVHRALGELRIELGRRLGLTDPREFRLCWVRNFPLFVHDEDRGTWESSHHPFTAPLDWDLEDYGTDTANIMSRAYDLCMNGWELGSGSIRIHRRDVQERVFRFLGISEEEQQRKFGFLLEAFRFGAPPHGGIALGVDRVVALALACDSIREVIAFPKTTSATDLMCDAPSPVAAEQLADLHIITNLPKKSQGHPPRR